MMCLLIRIAIFSVWGGVKIVTIAPKIIVAAGSVVTKNLDREGWLYAGIPAKPIKSFLK